MSFLINITHISSLYLHTT